MHMGIFCIFFVMLFYFISYMDGLVQERCNSIANALEFGLSCTKPSIYANGSASLVSQSVRL